MASLWLPPVYVRKNILSPPLVCCRCTTQVSKTYKTNTTCLPVSTTARPLQLKLIRFNCNCAYFMNPGQIVLTRVVVAKVSVARKIVKHSTSWPASLVAKSDTRRTRHSVAGVLPKGFIILRIPISPDMLSFLSRNIYHCLMPEHDLLFSFLNSSPH